jgi:AcrR family transcriptional regulator
MPKMSKEYLDTQRNIILDAAYAVCMEKPVYEVTMRDVIRKTGFSQGNIYRYFNNLDEILVELIYRECKDPNIIPAVDAVLSQDAPPEKIIRDGLDLFFKLIVKNILGVGKIQFEIQQLIINDPVRMKRLITEHPNAKDENYLREKGMEYIFAKIGEGYFHPKIHTEDLLPFLTISFNGAIRDLILAKHYQVPFPFPETSMNEDTLLESIITAFILLLGGDETIGRT